jgi:hypothetical protein
MDLLLIQARKGSQLLIFTPLREGIDALVAVVEMRQEDVGACHQSVSPIMAIHESRRSVAGGGSKGSLVSLTQEILLDLLLSGESSL